MHWYPPLLVGLLTAAALAMPTGHFRGRPTSAPAPRELLRTIAGLTDREWTAVDRGEAVARILTTDSQEIAVAGAIRINASPEALVERYRDIANLKRSAIVLDAGTFSPVPHPTDLARAVFEDRSLDLRDCRPGDCQVRLGTADIQRFHRQVDWRAPDWRVRSASVWREVLAGYAAAYQAHGGPALPVFVNKRERSSVASELATLASRFDFVADYSPALHAYFQHFGPGAPAGAEHMLYWTKEDFGVRPILRISHQIIHRPRPFGEPLLVATIQIYCDHYLDAALGIAMAIDVPESTDPGFYMIAVNRVRTRSLAGFFRSLIRSTVQGRSRDAMHRILTATKAAIEADARVGRDLPRLQRPPGPAARSPSGAGVSPPRSAS